MRSHYDSTALSHHDVTLATHNRSGLNTYKPLTEAVQSLPLMLLLFRFLIAVIALSASFVVHAQRIIIGQSLDLSGASSVGKDFSSGIRTYIDWVNSRGGIRGKRIELVQLDDAGNAATAVANITRLMAENEIDALLGPTSSEALLAITSSKVFVDASAPMIGGSVGTHSNRESNRVFRVRATTSAEVAKGLGHLMMLAPNAPMLIKANGSDSDAIAVDVAKELVRYKVSSFVRMTDAEFERAPLSKSPPGSVIVTGDAISLAAVVKRIRQQYGLIPILGFSSVDHRTLIDLSGKAAAGIILTQVMPSPTKTSHPYQREHQQLMKQFRDEPPTLHTLEGYVTARTLVAALERIDGDVTAPKVLAALRTLQNIDLGELRINLRDGSTNAFVDITAVSNAGQLLH
jgi:branched-chain amino acid transport system substrate-binding protein